MPDPIPPETPEQRQARHFASLRRTADIGMQLVEAYGQAALDDLRRTAEPHPGRPANHALFAAMSATLRATIALELRVETAAAARGPKRLPPRSPVLEDPRREMLREAFHNALVNDPDRSRRREADTVIDEHLLAHPKGTEPIEVTVKTLCALLHIKLNPRKLPDALISDIPIPRRPEFTSGGPTPRNPGETTPRW